MSREYFIAIRTAKTDEERQRIHYEYTAALDKFVDGLSLANRLKTTKDGTETFFYWLPMRWWAYRNGLRFTIGLWLFSFGLLYGDE